MNLNSATRPETSVVVARRLIAANVDRKIAKQIRAAVEEEKLIKVFPLDIGTKFGAGFQR